MEQQLSSTGVSSLDIEMIIHRSIALMAHVNDSLVSSKISSI